MFSLTENINLGHGTLERYESISKVLKNNSKETPKGVTASTTGVCYVH